MRSCYSLDLSDAAAVSQLNETADKILDILRGSYGARYFGDEATLDRLLTEQHKVYIYGEKEQTSGVFHVRPDGKISGVAVRADRRRQSICKILIEAAFEDFDHLFIEIDYRNDPMIHVVEGMQFAQVKEEDRVEDLLGDDYKKVVFFDVSRNRITYLRNSWHGGLLWRNNFVMYEKWAQR